MNALPKRILLATDGSGDAALAEKAAADISGEVGADLHVVHAWTDAPKPAYPGLSFDDYSRVAEVEARKILRRRAAKARDAGGRVTGQYLREGLPADEIVGLAGEIGADLVVVGSRRAGRVRRLITGSVSEGLVRGAPCPVLVVPGTDGSWPPARVVVGDDGSAPARRAGELAAGIASLFGAEVVLVRAHENPPEPIGGWSARERQELDEGFRRDREDLQELAERLGELASGRRPETKLLETGPGLAVASSARERERTLLAVGTRRHSAPRRVVQRSVSTRALRTSDGPVLIVPPERSLSRRSWHDDGGRGTRTGLADRDAARRGERGAKKEEAP